MSQTLLGNPRGPVEQGNSNTLTEVKLCLFFYLFQLKKLFAARLKLLFIQLAPTKFKLIRLKNFLCKQTETTVSRKNVLTKFMEKLTIHENFSPLKFCTLSTSQRFQHYESLTPEITWSAILMDIFSI